KRSIRGGFFFPKELPRPAPESGRSAVTFRLRHASFWQKDKNKNNSNSKKEKKKQEISVFLLTVSRGSAILCLNS
ncbi:MAG: hypothetical protein IIW78_02565, partial [Clostridia bacterium]|nr:hypothetical protein [Clostridia bacterium]